MGEDYRINFYPTEEEKNVLRREDGPIRKPIFKAQVGGFTFTYNTFDPVTQTELQVEIPLLGDKISTIIRRWRFR